MKNKRYRLSSLISLSLGLMIFSGCANGLQVRRPVETKEVTSSQTTIGTETTTTSNTTQGATQPGTQTATQTIAQTDSQTDTQAVTQPATEPATEPETKPVTKPNTKPAETKPAATKPVATKPAASKPVATKPVATKPVATKPAETKPVATKPAETKPAETKPNTKPVSEGGKYRDISNKRNEWSYGYPTSWVSDYQGYWNFQAGNIYLTMDLGYEAGYTDTILDTLKANGVKATFFVTTEYITSNEARVKRMLAEGHKVGNHSTKHINMVTLTETDVEDLIDNTKKWEKAYKAATGKTSHLYRAPEGVFSKRGMAVLKDLGYDNIFWGAAYADYDESNQPSIETAREKLYKYIDSGDVILLHPFKTNAEFLPIFIEEMRAKGYNFALVP